MAGFWAPIGSIQPLSCPASGFYCPGRAADTVNSPPGSLPIALSTGSVTEETTETVTVTETVEKVETTLTVDAALNTTDLQHELAALYGVPAEDIVIEEVAARRHLLAAAPRRRLAQTQYKIIVTTDPDNAASLAAAMNNTATGLAAAGGPNVTQSSVVVTTQVRNVTRNVTRQQQVDCPRGSWCTAGTVVPWCAIAAKRALAEA